MGAYIKAISYYLPEQVVTNEDLVSEFPEWSVEKVAAKVGVNVRHVAAVGETAGDMAEKAAKKLFEEYSIDSKDIDFLLLCTQSSDYYCAHYKKCSDVLFLLIRRKVIIYGKTDTWR